MMRWILRLFKPLKRNEVAQRRRQMDDEHIERLRAEVNRAARNIANLTTQLRPKQK